jgi:uncharacterized membrane protein YeaQ/YmgE (transglycosylase-associated protein family)
VEDEQMSLIAWIVVGIAAGLLARAVIGGEGPGGVIGDLVVGVVGAFIGGWIMQFLGHGGVTGINVWSIFVAFVGSGTLLLAMRMFTGKRKLA